MKKESRNYRLIVLSFLSVSLCMIALLFYIDLTQKSEIIQNRSVQGYRILDVSLYHEAEDPDAPIGIKREYVLDLGNLDEGDNCFAFYQVHHYIQIFLNEELVYSQMPGNRHAVSKSTGCGWVMIPLFSQDSGKQIRVILTPAYEAVRERENVFLVGSRHSIIAGSVKHDVDGFALSILAIGAGVIFIGVSLFWMFRKKHDNSLFYLGVFSVFLGCWKLTDIRSITLLIRGHDLLLSYVSLVMMALLPVPFILFLEKQIEKKRFRFLNLVCIVSVFVCGVQTALQFTGKMDLRESLLATHSMIALTVIAVIVSVVGELLQKPASRKSRITCICFLLCVTAAVLDLVLYYINDNSAGMLNTIAVFLLYIVTMGVMSISELSYEANVDIGTGLFNRSRCREIVMDETVLDEQTCLIMFDLNQLKKVNDTLGHEAGDELIFRFSDILRQNMPARAFLGRYGGDEFIAVLKQCDESMAEKILGDIAEAVNEYNSAEGRVQLYYAAGYALSAEYPDCSMRFLLEKADERMYLDKKGYYDRLKDEAKADKNR